ncbi:MAG: elongation factor 1-beta [Patescibacteria group bacterium]|jgi:elongation factor 1-beta
MAAMNAVKFKIMPNSPDTDLAVVKDQAEAKITEMGGNPSGSEEQPIAFGLKALVLSFAYPEDKEIDEVENELAKIEGVTSVELEDYRKAIG